MIFPRLSRGALSLLTMAAAFNAANSLGEPHRHHHGNEVTFTVEGGSNEVTYTQNPPLTALEPGEVEYQVTVPTKGMCPTDKKEVSLCTSRLFLNPGQNKTFRFDRNFVIREVKVNVESAGRGGSAFAIYTNGIASATYKVPNYDPPYTIPVNQTAREFTISSTGVEGPQGQLVITSVNVVVSPVGQETSEAVCYVSTRKFCPECEFNQVPFPVHYKTVMGNYASRVATSVHTLEKFFNDKQRVCYLTPVKKAAVMALGRAEGLGDAHRGAAPFFRVLLEELDCAAPLFDDGVEREVAEAEVSRIVTIREKIRKDLGLGNNICSLEKLKALVAKGCADGDYVTAIAEKQRAFVEWEKEWDRDVRQQVQSQQAALQQYVDQLNQPKPAPAPDPAAPAPNGARPAVQPPPAPVPPGQGASGVPGPRPAANTNPGPAQGATPAANTNGGQLPAPPAPVPVPPGGA